MPKVAVVQLCSTPIKEDNYRQAERYIEESARAGAALVVLPENWAYIGPEEAKEGAAETGDGPSLSKLSEWSRRFGVWILGGTVLKRSDLPTDERPTNHCTVWDDQGTCRAVYDKIHLFDAAIPGGAVFQESQRIQPGVQPVVVDTPAGVLGLSVCYDLRFGWLHGRWRGPAPRFRGAVRATRWTPAALGAVAAPVPSRTSLMWSHPARWASIAPGAALTGTPWRSSPSARWSLEWWTSPASAWLR